MPVLFGNTYILPAIIVVVLVVLLLLVIVLRKRGSTSSRSKTAAKSERQVASPSRPIKVERVPAHAAPAVAEPGLPEAGTVQPSTGASAAASTAAHPGAVRADISPQADPLHAVILDILQGWGDIADEDTKRLSLFRPEKVLAAVQALEVPRELKSSQHARTRLTQLRQYAANSVDRSRERQEAAPAAMAPADEPEAPQIPVELPEPPTPEEQLETPLFHPVVGAPVEIPMESPVEAHTEIPAETLVEETAIALETVQESPLETTEVPVSEPIASEMSEQETSFSQDSAETTPTWQAEGAPAFFDERESSLSSLHNTVKTADEIFALPAEERPDMVAFLEPAELSRVFDGTDDPGLKKAIVDTLEHVSNPASLEVLRRCLDDPDPQIQLYALEAADRLLGVD